MKSDDLPATHLPPGTPGSRVLYTFTITLREREAVQRFINVRMVEGDASLIQGVLVKITAEPEFVKPPKQFKAGDVIEDNGIKYTLLRPVVTGEVFPGTDGQSVEISNDRGNKWWAATSTNETEVLVCTDGL